MKNLFTYLIAFLFLLMTHHANAQQLKLVNFLPSEYQFNIKEEDEEEGIFATSYEAVEPQTKLAPFEIIVTEMPQSLTDLKGTAKALEENTKNYTDKKWNLLKQDESEGLHRRLYQLSNERSTVLVLMYEKEAKFTMVEVEFHPKDFETVSLERWQDIFWEVK